MRESESGEECGVKHSARIKPVGSVASFLFDEESLRLGCQMSRATPATVLGSTVTFLVSSGKRAAPCLTSAPKSSCQASVPIVAVLRRRRRRASLSLREKQHVFPRTHAALDASPDQGKGNITDRIWLRPFFLRLSKCEQRHHCFGVTVFDLASGCALFHFRAGRYPLGAPHYRVRQCEACCVYFLDD